MTETATRHAPLLESVKRMDMVLLGSVALIVTIGLCFIASATRSMVGAEASMGYIGRQLIFVLLGVGILLAIQRVSYLTILRHAPLLYLVGLLLLCGVFLMPAIKGAHCWYNLYFFNFEPSELMKPILIITLAHYLMYRDSYKK